MVLQKNQAVPATCSNNSALKLWAMHVMIAVVNNESYCIVGIDGIWSVVNCLRNAK